MKLIETLYNRFIMSQYIDDETTPDVIAWKKYLNSIPEPKNNIDRTYNKYLCKKYYYTPIKLFIMRAISFILLIPEYFLLMLPSVSLPDKRERSRLLLEELNHLDYHDVVPQMLLDAYSEVIVVPFSKKMFGRLNNDSKELFRECAKKSRDPFFRFLVYKDLAKHSALLNHDNPSSMALYASERNVSSPVITELYERNGRKFVSFMHGDYLFELIRGFMQFSEYYVWDESYTEMFVKDSRCDPEQFRVYTPKKLRKKWNFEGRVPEFFCTYYFSGVSEKSIDALLSIYREFEACGKKCKVRLHPRWSIHESLIREKFQDFYIEEPRIVSMEESLASTEYVIGLFSTVLNEAFVEGKKVVVDDETSKEQFEDIKQRHYIMLNKEHILLSELKDSVYKNFVADVKMVSST